MLQKAGAAYRGRVLLHITSLPVDKMDNEIKPCSPNAKFLQVTQFVAKKGFSNWKCSYTTVHCSDLRNTQNKTELIDFIVAIHCQKWLPAAGGVYECLHIYKYNRTSRVRDINR